MPEPWRAHYTQQLKLFCISSFSRDALNALATYHNQANLGAELNSRVLLAVGGVFIDICVDAVASVYTHLIFN